jgi:hypothetical protein
LCHGLTDQGLVIRRLWARSDWPLVERVVASTTGRVRHCRITARLCDLALDPAIIAVEPDMLRYMAADHARDLPGVEVKRGVFELERWRDVALGEWERLKPRDSELRAAAAERIAGRSEFFQLFGVPELIGDEAAIARKKG